MRTSLFVALLFGTLTAAATAEEVKFKKIVLSDKFHSEGAAVGDFNGDGKLDIVIGNKKGTFLFLRE